MMFVTVNVLIFVFIIATCVFEKKTFINQNYNRNCTGIIMKFCM